jgi:hypothetical protein
MTITTEDFEDPLAPTSRIPRSRAAIASGIAMLAALPLAIATALALGGGDGVVVHGILGLGMTFLLVATGDFRMPRAITWIGRLGIAALGTIFFLQGLADAVQWQPLSMIAYDVIGQFIEKAAIYPVLLWFAGLLAYDSKGKSRLFGALVLGALLAAELYSLWTVLSGGSPDVLLRALYLLPFVWLLFEGTKRRFETH